MYLSLNEKLARLDGTTKVFVGHEYTRKNLEFALTLEPDRVPVREKAKRVAALRAQGQPTVPSTIDEEKSTNPFLRVTSPGIIASVAGDLGARKDPVSVFAAVRAAKDRF
jgi:hydroxyacylglutathione hydrolase